MSALLVDVGNSRLKWQHRDGDSVLSEHQCALAEVTSAPWPEEVSRVLVASVRDHTDLHQFLQRIYGQRLVWLAHPPHSDQRIHHCYPDPARLGVDRWLAMLGARSYKEGALLVVDAGTALTIDLLDAEDRHVGGYIVPGLTTSREVLFSRTDKVRPFADEADAGALLPGQNTLNCVAAGTLRQQVALVQSVADEYPDYQLMLTGGDGEQLAGLLCSRHYPDLVFNGMNQICAGLFTASS